MVIPYFLCSYSWHEGRKMTCTGAGPSAKGRKGKEIGGRAHARRKALYSAPFDFSYTFFMTILEK